jgi:transcriptional regulator with XRE-family HTH domain
MNEKPFTGNDVRELRTKHKLTRKQMGELLGVAAVTIEKWELAGDHPIRPKYHEALGKIAGLGAGAGMVGAIAAPAVLAALPVAGIVGLGILGAKKLWTDGELDQAEEMLRALRRLSPEERETWISLCKKMVGESSAEAQS